MRSIAYASLFVAAALAAPAAPGQAIPLLNRDLKEVEALARADSNDAETQFYLALAYWKRHRWQQVDSVLRLVVRLDPRFAEAYLALYYLPYSRRPSLFQDEERGRIPEEWRKPVEEAQHFYQLAFRTDPLVKLRVITVAFEIEEPRFTDYTSEAYRVYARYYAWLVDLGLGRYRSAYENLNRLAEREFAESKHPERVPDYILWYRGIAAAHSLQLKPAIADFQALLDRAKKQEQKDEVVHVPLRLNEYRFMLAALHHVASHPDTAIALYEEALENDLGLVMAHTYLAGIYQSAGRAAEALQERQRAAEIGFDDAPAQLDLAIALFNVQQAAAAEEPARRAVELNPRYAPSYYLLGRVAEELGRPAEARDYYTQFLGLAPKRLADFTGDAQTRLTALK